MVLGLSWPVSSMYCYRAIAEIGPEVLADLFTELIKPLLCNINFSVAYWPSIPYPVRISEPDRRQFRYQR